MHAAVVSVCRPPRAARARLRCGLRVLLTVAVVVVVTAVGGCGNGDDSGGAAPGTGGSSTSGGAPVGSVDAAALAAAAGDAAAAQGVELAEQPGDPERTGLADFGETAVAVTAPDGTVTGWCVLVAMAEDQRRRGLMEVTDLGGYAGMLFVFSEDTETGFWMRNTPTPLSIAYIDAGGELVSTADMAPCPADGDCPSYAADGPYRFALEVPQGELPTLGIAAGSRLAAGGECAPPTDGG